MKDSQPSQPAEMMPEPSPGSRQFEYRQLAQMLELKAPRVQIEIGTADLICVIAQLQLALRHPANRSKTAFSAWSAKEFFIGFLGGIQPGIGKYLHQGDGSYFDRKAADARAKRDNGEGGVRIVRP